MNLGDKVKVTSPDGLVPYGVGVVDSVGTAHTGGARVKMPDGSTFDVGYYKVTHMPGRPKQVRKYGSKRIV